MSANELVVGSWIVTEVSVLLPAEREGGREKAVHSAKVMWRPHLVLYRFRMTQLAKRSTHWTLPVSTADARWEWWTISARRARWVHVEEGDGG